MKKFNEFINNEVNEKFTAQEESYMEDLHLSSSDVVSFKCKNSDFTVILNKPKNINIPDSYQIDYIAYTKNNVEISGYLK